MKRFDCDSLLLALAAEFLGFAILPTTIALGMGIGFITGLLAAIVPSIRASKTQPALAVRK